MPLVYPTDADIKTFGSAMGVFGDLSSANIDAMLDGVGDAIKRDWENHVGWKPFLCETAEDAYTLRSFDPPGHSHHHYQGSPRWIDGGKVLMLDTGILALEEIRQRVTPDFAGDLLVENEHFWQMPYNATEKGLRVTSIKFSWMMQGLPKSITISARFGYAIELPEDVYFGLRSYGLSKAIRNNLAKFATQPVEWQEGDVRERYGTTFVQDVMKDGEKDFRSLIKRYRYAGL